MEGALARRLIDPKFLLGLLDHLALTQVHVQLPFSLEQSPFEAAKFSEDLPRVIHCGRHLEHVSESVTLGAECVLNGGILELVIAVQRLIYVLLIK